MKLHTLFILGGIATIFSGCPSDRTVDDYRNDEVMRQYQIALQQKGTYNGTLTDKATGQAIGVASIAVDAQIYPSSTGDHTITQSTVALKGLIKIILGDQQPHQIAFSNAYYNHPSGVIAASTPITGAQAENTSIDLQGNFSGDHLSGDISANVGGGLTAHFESDRGVGLANAASVTGSGLAAPNQLYYLPSTTFIAEHVQWTGKLGTNVGNVSQVETTPGTATETVLENVLMMITFPNANPAQDFAALFNPIKSVSIKLENSTISKIASIPGTLDQINHTIRGSTPGETSEINCIGSASEANTYNCVYSNDNGYTLKLSLKPTQI